MSELKLNKDEAVYCVSEDSANKVLEIAHDLGYKWGSGLSYKGDTNYEMYKGNICYDINGGLFGSLESFEKIGYKIITAGEFLIRHQGNLEALANYLPYNLKFVENNDKNEVDATYYKPLFRPLSELFNGNYEDILDEFSDFELYRFKESFFCKVEVLNRMDYLSYTQAQALFKNHFDVFGLIDKDKAYNINDYI